jgi:GT2 family glycosyltransferase
VKYPPISIAMPFWNRPTELARSRQAYDTVYPDLDIEFSIADDGSTPPLVQTQDPKVRLISMPPKARAMNPCVPINRAVRNCTRDIIVLTNPEVVHTEPVLHRMIEALEWPNDYVMTGCRNAPYSYRQGLALKKGEGEWIAGPEAPRAPVGGRQPIPPGTTLHFCVMFHRELFERAGGFDEEYRNGSGCEDNDWLWRLWALGDVNFKFVPGETWHYITRHNWHAPKNNAALLKAKWGHLKEFRECVS